MGSKRLFFAAAAMVTALVTSGCGSNAGGGESPAVPTSVGSTAQRPTSAPSSGTENAAKTCTCVIVLAYLSEDNSYELRFIDPATKTVVGTRPFSYGADVHTLFGGGGTMTGTQIRSAFNADFTMVAATKDGGTGSDMVGGIWFSGAVSDFSAGIAAPSAASGFGVKVQRGLPVYGPDGREYYVEQQGDDNALMAVGRDGSPQKLDKYDRFAAVTTAEKPIYFFPGDGEPRNSFTDRAVFSRQDKWGFRVSSNGGAIEYGNLAAGQVNSVELPKGGYGVPMQAAPLAYLDKTSYVSVENKTSAASTLSQVMNKTTVSGGRITNTPLTPPTDGDIKDPAVSPDGEKVVLALVKGGKTSLLTVDVKGGVKSLAPLYDFAQDDTSAKTYRVLGWQKVTLK